MSEFITEWWHGMLVGCGLAFVIFCITSAIEEYYHTRRMKALDARHRLRMKYYTWLYGRVRPLFHEQGKDDEP